jgi:methyl-accepting chemotaxis protein
MTLMQSVRQKGIQRELIVSFLILGLVPMIIMGGVSYYNSSKLLLKNANTEMENRTANTIEQLDAQFRMLRTQMDGLESPGAAIISDIRVGTEVFEGSRDNLAAFYREYMKANPTFKRIRLLDGKGIERVSSAGTASGAPRDASAEPWFKKSSAAKDVIFGDITVSQDVGEPVIVMTKTFLGQDGKPFAMLAADLSGELVTRPVTGIKIGNTGSAFILNKEGMVVAHADKTKNFKLNYANYDFGKEILQRKRGTIEYDWEGSSRYASYQSYPAMEWVIVAATDKGDILESVNKMQIVFVILGIVMALLSLTAGFFYARRIAKPVQRIVNGLSDGADQVASASAQVSSSSQHLAEGASVQAASLEETSSSLEEMSTMTKHNADNASQAKSMMTEAKVVVEKANNQMVQLMQAIGEITRSSEETGKIIKTIDEIAFQTNLLALNAAVEAARAGEAGAGFAVVADEVRNLALRAAEAAKNTTALIEKTIKAVKNGNEITVATQVAFKANAEISGKIGHLVDEIATASQEQAHGVAQVNKAVSEMDRVTQQTAAHAEESASAAEEMNAQAQQMRGYVEELASVVGGDGERLGAGHPRKALPEGRSERRTNQPRLAEALVTGKTPRKPIGGVKPKALIPFGQDEKDAFKDF